MLENLFEVIKDRKLNADPDSYTASLFAEGENKILRKVGEESLEIILAAKSETDQRLIEESADLLYHLLVLLAAKNIELEDVYEELRRREK